MLTNFVWIEIGQYFMTQDTAEFSHFTNSVARRDYTASKDEASSEPKKVGSREHQNWIRIGICILLLTR